MARNKTPIAAEAAILQALIAGQAYGLEINDRIESSTSGRVRFSAGTLYPALRALEKDGLLRSWEEAGDSTRGGRPRRYYELTGDGLRAAREDRKVAPLFGMEVVPC